MNWTNIKSALAMGLVSGVLAMIAFILLNGSIFTLDIKGLVDAGVLAGLTSISAFITTNFLTTQRGNFVGAVKIKDIN